MHLCGKSTPEASKTFIGFQSLKNCAKLLGSRAIIIIMPNDAERAHDEELMANNQLNRFYNKLLKRPWRMTEPCHRTSQHYVKFGQTCSTLFRFAKIVRWKSRQKYLVSCCRRSCDDSVVLFFFFATFRLSVNFAASKVFFFLQLPFNFVIMLKLSGRFDGLLTGNYRELQFDGFLCFW